MFTRACPYRSWAYRRITTDGGPGFPMDVTKVEEMMTVYSGPVFDMAVNQFGVIANHLEIPMDERDRILMPKRAITISCPVHRDDGSIAVFEGYDAPPTAEGVSRATTRTVVTSSLAVLGLDFIMTALMFRGV